MVGPIHVFTMAGPFGIEAGQLLSRNGKLKVVLSRKAFFYRIVTKNVLKISQKLSPKIVPETVNKIVPKFVPGTVLELS